MAFPIKEPFDPSTIEVEVKNITIGTLVDMLKNDAIDLSPAFQRKKDLWSDKEKSRLIESVMLGLPLPSFYFITEKSNKKWVVIDGLQRLCSLKKFAIDKTLTLKGLDFLDRQYGGKTYNDLEYFEKLSFSMLSVTVNVLKGDTPPEVKYVIFQRINSAGTPLKPQEIRNALNQGAATRLLDEMAEEPLFKRMTKGVSTERMADKEFITRFFAFYLMGYGVYNGDMDAFLNVAMNRLNKLDESQLQKTKVAFRRSLYVCYQLLGDDAFRKPSPNSQRRNPVSKALFDSLMVSISKRTENEQEELMRRMEAFKKYYIEVFQDRILQRNLSEGTGKYKSVEYRFRKMEEIIDKTLEGNEYDKNIRHT